MTLNVRPRKTVVPILWFVLLIPLLAFAQDTSQTAPYIYYLSNVAHGLVIERADGSDSRILAADSIPAEHSALDHVEWSVSGEWVSWMSRGENGGIAMPSSGWIARTDGSLRLQRLDEMGGTVFALKWSPTADVLFVAHSDSSALRLMIIDVNQDRILAQTDYESTGQYGPWAEGIQTDWLADGSGVAFALDLSDTFLLDLLGTDNHLNTRLLNKSIGPLFSLVNGRAFYYTQATGAAKPELVMEDLATHKQLLVESGRDPDVYYQVYWNQSMKAALIFGVNCRAHPCSYRLHWMNWERGETREIADNLAPSGSSNMPFRNFMTIQPLWSPDERFAMLWDESTHALQLIDGETGGITPIEIEGVEQALYWVWVAKQPYVLLQTDTSTSIYRFDLNTHAVTTLDYQTDNLLKGIVPSPDGRILGFNGFNTSNDAVDLQTGREWKWPHHSLGASAGPILNYLWSDDSHWFMTGEMTAFAGGGPGPSGVTVLNTDTTVRRELSVCWSLGQCAGFVPERVIAHLKPGSERPIIQEPILSLLHEGKVSGVAWSPDGKKIASYSANSLTGSLNIWDVSGTPRLEVTYETTQAYGLYPAATNLFWSADGKTITVSDQTVQESWDLETGTMLSSGDATGFASPDGKLGITLENTWHDVAIVTTASHETLAQFSFDEQILWTGWSSDSQTAFLQMPGEQLGVWNRGELRTLDAKNLAVYSADYHEGGRWIVGGSLFQRVHVWDAKTGERMRDLNWYATGLALSPNGSLLAAAGTRLVTIWDTVRFGK